MVFSLQKTIGLRLLRYVFGCYFAVTVIVTSFQLISEYLYVKENIFIELSNLGETVKDSLSVSIWNYDTEQIKTTLLGITKIAMVVGAKVVDINDKPLVSIGKTAEKKDRISITKERDSGRGIVNKISYSKDRQEKVLFEYKFPIYFTDSASGSEVLISYCYIYTAKTLVIDRVKHGFILIIANALIKTFALWLIFLFFTRRIIARPLNILTQATRELDPGNPEYLCANNSLDKMLCSGHDDELHILASSFLKMRNAIIENISVIKQQSLTLEDRVKERTLTIEKINRELKHLSLHDPLTGLPNRNLFHDRLEHLLNAAKRDGSDFAVASIDLCKFKDINDTFGHQAGDAVLKELSKRMKAAMRGIDTIARMGGDEFAVLVPGVDKERINLIGEKIVACTHDPIIFESQGILSGINVGFSLYPEHADNADTLFRKSDLAMYQAKRNQDSIALYTPTVIRELERHEIISRHIGSAIENDQLDVFYQPIICGKTHKVNGVEALVRWQHPELGFVPPDEFIGIAERSNTIKTITNWVIQRALSDVDKFSELGYDLTLSINLSGRLIGDIAFADSLESIIQAYNYPKEKIIMEITESSMMKNPQQILRTLNKLKAIGVNLSIDDFGTGYSSFSYLARLPVDELKIDRSFLQDSSDSSQIVVEAIIALAHRLGLHVVAEGVETERMLHTMEEMGCDYIQGYFFSRPIPPNELIEWLALYVSKTCQHS